MSFRPTSSIDCHVASWKFYIQEKHCFRSSLWPAHWLNEDFTESPLWPISNGCVVLQFPPGLKWPNLAVLVVSLNSSISVHVNKAAPGTGAAYLALPVTWDANYATVPESQLYQYFIASYTNLSPGHSVVSVVSLFNDTCISIEKYNGSAFTRLQAFTLQVCELSCRVLASRHSFFWWRYSCYWCSVIIMTLAYVVEVGIFCLQSVWRRSLFVAIQLDLGWSVAHHVTVAHVTWEKAMKFMRSALVKSGAVKSSNRWTTVVRIVQQSFFAF